MTVGFNTGSKWFDNYMEAYYEVIECYYKAFDNTYFDYTDYYKNTILASAKATAKSLEGVYDSVYYNDYYDDFYRNYFNENSWNSIWSGYGYGDCDVDKITKKWGFSSQRDKPQDSGDSNNNDDGISPISTPRKFKNKFVDKIINFKPLVDTLEIDSGSFGIKDSITFMAGKNKRVVKKKLSRQDFDFLYDEKKGGLYFNENGADIGFGDGGIIAILKGAPDLTIKSIDFL